MNNAIIFDLDGCLVDSELICLGAIADEMVSLGIKDARADKIGKQFLGIGMSVISDYVSDKLGGICSLTFQSNVEARILNEYQFGLHRINGVTRMLIDLQEQDIKIGIATGGSQTRMKATLEVSGLAHFFNGTAYSVDEVSKGKPAPDLFLLAADRLQVVPEKCIVIEDSPHGVRGAIAAGMSAIGFVGGSHLRERHNEHSSILSNAGAREVCKNIDDVRRLILSDVASVKL